MKNFLFFTLSLVTFLIHSQNCITDYTINYFENFDGVPTSDVPICWSKYPLTSTSSAYVNSYIEGGTNTRIRMRSALSIKARLVSPQLVDFGADKRISFSIYSDAKTSLSIGTMSDPQVGSTYIKYKDINSYDSNGYQWRNYHIDFSNYIGTDTYVAFELTGYAIVSFDDFIYELSPTCVPPIDLTTSVIHSTEAILDWTDYSGATTWDIEYGEQGFEQGTGILISNVTKPYNLSNLLPSTNYDYYVMSNCSSSNKSEWSQLGVFNTRCEAKEVGFTYDFDDVYPRDFDSCWKVIGNSSISSGVGNSTFKNYLSFYSYSEQNLVSTPELKNIDNTKRIKFWVNNTDGNSGLTIGTITNPDDINTFTPYKTYS